jgi:hypothetical protein
LVFVISAKPNIENIFAVCLMKTLVQEGEAAESRLSQDGRSTVSIRTEAEVVQGGLQEEASKIAVFSPFATM